MEFCWENLEYDDCVFPLIEIEKVFDPKVYKKLKQTFPNATNYKSSPSKSKHRQSVIIKERDGNINIIRKKNPTYFQFYEYLKSVDFREQLFAIFTPEIRHKWGFTGITYKSSVELECHKISSGYEEPWSVDKRIQIVKIYIFLGGDGLREGGELCIAQHKHIEETPLYPQYPKLQNLKSIKVYPVQENYAIAFLSTPNSYHCISPIRGVECYFVISLNFRGPCAWKCIWRKNPKPSWFGMELQQNDPELFRKFNELIRNQVRKKIGKKRKQRKKKDIPLPIVEIEIPKMKSHFQDMDMFFDISASHLSYACVCIPAIFKSNFTLLKLDNDKTILQTTCEQALRAKLPLEIYVMTDHAEIHMHIRHEFHEKVSPVFIPNSGKHYIDHVAANLQHIPAKYQYICVLNPNQPMIDPKNIDYAIQKFVDSQHGAQPSFMTTLHYPSYDPDVISGDGNIHNVTDRNHRMMYCSSKMMPHVPNNDFFNFIDEQNPTRHAFHFTTDIWVFHRKTLQTYHNMEETLYAKMEEIHWLKILEHGHCIYSYPVITLYQSPIRNWNEYSLLIEN